MSLKLMSLKKRDDYSGIYRNAVYLKAKGIFKRVAWNNQ